MDFLPDPSAKHRIKVDIAFVVREQNIENGRRLVIKFRQQQNTNAYSSQLSKEREPTKQMYDSDQKIVLYISQKGRVSAIWMDDCFWKVTRRKKLKKEDWHAPLTLKVDVQKATITEAHEKSIQRCAAKYL
jgi:hypothetical protein